MTSQIASTITFLVAGDNALSAATAAGNGATLVSASDHAARRPPWRF